MAYTTALGYRPTCDSSKLGKNIVNLLHRRLFFVRGSVRVKVRIRFRVRFRDEVRVRDGN